MPMKKTIQLTVTMTQPLWPYQVVDEIQKVMEKGERDGKRGWTKQSVGEHIRRALVHLHEYQVVQDNHLQYKGYEDHLAHAFTRLMMAIAVERGYAKPEGGENGVV